MQAIRCELCGSQDIVKEDGLFVCRNCKTKYSPDEARKLVGTVKIDNSETVENLFTLARRAFQTRNYADAERYYTMILPEAPDNVEACFFREISKAMAIGPADSWGEFPAAYLNGIRTVFVLYKKNGYDEKEKDRIDALADFILGHAREMEQEIRKAEKAKAENAKAKKAGTKDPAAANLAPIHTMNNLTAVYAGLEKELKANLPDRPETIEKVKKAYANFLRRKNNKIPEKA